MYTYGMYRLNTCSREDILTRLREKIAKCQDILPQVDGYQPDLATSKRVYFAAESPDRIAQCMAAIRAFAHAGQEVVLAVPDMLKDTAAEAWDYLPDDERARVRILLLPFESPQPTA
ncbi:MAG: hypothetical protein G8345_02720 [Magnetococcales bacterium]|nr:hypothetical protein [Magnetococcales bacterium]NGZ25785.1 hypothetical protein [Magnetococcales bacterium]